MARAVLIPSAREMVVKIRVSAILINIVGQPRR